MLQNSSTCGSAKKNTGQGPIINIFYLFLSDYFYVFQYII